MKAKFEFAKRGGWDMAFNIIEPKYFMLKCKYIVPELTYESYLIEVINGSTFFRSKCSFMEHYQLVEKQSNGEDDAYTSTYQLDFKLLVDENVMRARNNNKPEVDYSHMSQGFIFTKSKENVSEVPKNNILMDIINCSYEEIVNGSFKNSTIKNLVKNIGKKKNIFMYYPYEFTCNCDPLLTVEAFENMLTSIFKVLLEYREKTFPEKDTFVCIKINSWFLVFEWVDKKFLFRDKINELMCGNYRNVKTYSVY